MSKELKFFIYLLERYAEQKGTDAQKIIAEWDELGVTDYIYEMYEIYHIEKDRLWIIKDYGSIARKRKTKRQFFL